MGVHWGLGAKGIAGAWEFARQPGPVRRGMTRYDDAAPVAASAGLLADRRWRADEPITGSLLEGETRTDWVA